MSSRLRFLAFYVGLVTLAAAFIGGIEYSNIFRYPRFLQYYIGVVTTAAAVISTIASFRQARPQAQQAPKPPTPHLDALPAHVWDACPHLNREEDAVSVDALKRTWNAYFVVLPRGLQDMYCEHQLLEIMEEVTGTRVPMWDTITDQQVVEMASLMNEVRDRLFMGLLQLWSREIFDAQVEKLRQGRAWYLDGEKMFDTDFLDERMEEEGLEGGEDDEDGNYEDEGVDDYGDDEEEEGVDELPELVDGQPEEVEEEEHGDEDLPELVVGQVEEVKEDLLEGPAYTEQPREGLGV